MGSKSSTQNDNYTSTTTNTENKANQNSFNGDMTGNVMSGIEGSTINITDGGAVNAALEAVFNNNKEAFSFGSEALGVNEAVTKAALSNNENVLEQALNFGRDAMMSAESATGSALDVAKNLSLDSDAATARDANKNMMYSTVAVAVVIGLGFFASKGK